MVQFSELQGTTVAAHRNDQQQRNPLSISQLDAMFFGNGLRRSVALT
jgi:hypothetical protein